jgi:hypothetical protein
MRDRDVTFLDFDSMGCFDGATELETAPLIARVGRAVAFCTGTCSQGQVNSANADAVALK